MSYQDGESEEKEGKEEKKKVEKPKRVYEKQPLLIPFDLVHGNSVRVFCAICRKEYLNRYLLKVIKHCRYILPHRSWHLSAL